MDELRKMGAAAAAAVALAVVDLVGIAVVTQMKNNSLIDNTTADLFIDGLVIFGSFMGLIVIVLVGKVVLGLLGVGGLGNKGGGSF